MSVLHPICHVSFSYQYIIDSERRWSELMDRCSAEMYLTVKQLCWPKSKVVCLTGGTLPLLSKHPPDFFGAAIVHYRWFVKRGSDLKVH